ncbi:DUF3617 domain-containing protein [Chitinibacteraceae bacterium HSL-7]
MRITVVAFLLLATSTSLATEAPPLTPQLGQWRISSEMPPEQKAVLAKLDARTLKAMTRNGTEFDVKNGLIVVSMCLNQSNIERWSQQSDTSIQCDPPRYSLTGHTMTMTLQCHTPESMTMHGVYRFNAARDRYDFDMTVTSPTRTVRQRGQAVRTGAC